MNARHPSPIVLATARSAVAICRTALLIAVVAMSGCGGRAPWAVRPVDVPPEDLRSVVQGTNDFGLDLFRRAAPTQTNCALSPVSIALALAMTEVGARGETAAQLRKALRTGLSGSRSLQASQSMLAALHPDTAAVEFTIANAAWPQKTASADAAGIRREFLDAIARHFGASAEPLDFVADPEAARTRINRWVSERTRGRIDDLFAPGSIDRDTRLILTNAVYFLGRWKTPFEVSSTRPAPFRSLSGAPTSVQMMEEEDKYEFAETDEVRVLRLPYEGGFSMTLVLPIAADGFPAMLASLDRARIDRWTAALKEQRVHVRLPRFEVNRRLGLRPVLSELGLAEMFTDRADFSGMVAEGNLPVQDVVHRVFLRLDEAGTEAAAATGAKLGVTSMPATFTADRPFVYLLRDDRTGTILFIGCLTDPGR